MLYGFNDRQTAEKLKEFASNIGKLPSQSFPVTQDNGSRVFLVSLSEPIGAMSKDSSSIGSPSAANAKILKRNTSNELEVQKNAFSDEDYFVTVQNVSGNAIPQTSEELLPEEIHLAVQDSFGGLFLVPQVSELFGTLESSWSRGDDTPQSITLDAGFERSGSVFTASPAPTLSEDLPAGTAMKLFDFYEYVVENAFDGLNYLLARFFYRDNCYYACIDAVCSLDLTALQTEEISVSESDENCFTLSFKMEGGDGK